MAHVQNLSPNQVATQMKNQEGELIDVRTASEFEAGYIANAKNIDFLNGDFEKAIPNLDKTKTYYLYCRSGGRSGKSAELLIAAGFGQVFNIGGFDSLAQAGLPVEY
jgi:phage shock protein E